MGSREEITLAQDWVEAGVAAGLATVVSTWGSSPRPPGSRLVVSATGGIAGSVSNGCVEGAVVEAVESVLAGSPPQVIEYGVADELAFDFGLACGGRLEVLVQTWTEAHSALAAALAGNRPARLCTRLSDGTTTLELDEEVDESVGVSDGWLVEGFPARQRLVLVGAVHIAEPLAALGAELGYAVTVIDPRERFATRERFPSPTQLLVDWPDTALAALAVDRSTHVVVLTHEPRFDLAALRVALGAAGGYIGVIGSPATQARRHEALASEGFDPEQLSRIHGPVGLDLGGREAPEIALAILAEITAFRHGSTGRPLREIRRAADQRLAGVERSVPRSDDQGA